MRSQIASGLIGSNGHNGPLQGNMLLHTLAARWYDHQDDQPMQAIHTREHACIVKALTMHLDLFANAPINLRIS